MAIVRRLKRLVLEKETRHLETECTYSIVTDDRGLKYLQGVTYGSTQRQIPDKKSQSIRFAPEAISEFKQLLTDHF